MKKIDLQELPIIPEIEIDAEVEKQLPETILESLQTQIFETFERERITVLKIKISISPSCSKKQNLDIEVHSDKKAVSAVAINLPLYLCFLPIISIRKVDNNLRLIFQARTVNINHIKKSFKKYHK